MNLTILASINANISKQTTSFTNSLTKISWQSIAEHALSRLLMIVTITVAFAFILWIGRWLINRTFKRYLAKTPLAPNRTNTIRTLTLNIFRYTCFFFYLYAILSLIGVPVGTLIAGAGIFSIALGLGAQGFVSDVVTGFFILIEQQIDVGDVIQIGTIKGTVTSLGIRTTQVTSADGTLNFIPNRNITIVSNFSRNNMHVQIDIRIDSNAPLNQIKTIVTSVNEKLNAQFAEVTSGPDIVGPTLNSNNLLVFRITVTTENGAQEKIRSAYLSEYLSALQEQHVTLIKYTDKKDLS
ncbi:MscS mechanosensitive ion channel [Paucilactobacillus vaccinostercus DSM 20634]|uniref:MscS mechanosensitive ion channel n=1 Tax=Paucilactobacillus vaccinostercus DSM 20634 TaxID=1423813 RepID=A0A0R2A4E7_9LACO|nr:MscS mechanosensitive ion channel [Paucilactobacillus vaccinostercus DSM 20634]